VSAREAPEAETPDTSQPAAAPSEPPTADNATSENAASDNAASDNAVATPETTPAAEAGAGNDVPQFGDAAARAAVITALDPTPRAPPAAPAESAKKPREYGAENTDARVIIRATDDSWVQVRDKDGQLLLTRVLRVGDSYRVPNDAGVVMRTGNAGGLDIQVDGESVPRLGPKGAIRHEVVLDADRLKAGTAIRR